jgi:hypothetical protein
MAAPCTQQPRLRQVRIVAASTGNAVDYFEIGSPDPDAVRSFFGGLFDGQIGSPSAPARYSMVEGDRGGLWDTSGVGAPNWAIFYLRVDDVNGQPPVA